MGDQGDYVDFAHKTTYALLAETEVCLLPESQGPMFLKVTGFENKELPAGWRLARHDEVQEHLDQVKEKLGPWDICMLADDWKIDGPGYGCRIQKQRSKEGIGHAIFVKDGWDLHATPSAKDSNMATTEEQAEESRVIGLFNLGKGKAIGAYQEAMDGLQKFCEEANDLRVVYWKAARSVLQWLLPAVLVLASMLAEAVSSRLTTFYYVRYMTMIDKLFGGADLSDRDSNELPSVSPLDRDWIYTHHRDYPQKLQDLTASWLQDALVVPMWVWDVSAVVLPAFALLAIILGRDKFVYCKVALGFAFVMMGRAACGVLTVVPDSSGWETCKERLGLGGDGGSQDIASIEHASADLLDFHKEFWKSLMRVLKVEAGGFRYCGDMIYSKHCFLLLLSTLALNEVFSRHQKHRVCLRVCVGVVTWAYTLAASFATVAARYHYSIDVFLAIIITVPVYDSQAMNSISRELTNDVAAETSEQLQPLSIDRKEKDGESAFSLGKELVTHLSDVAGHVWNMIDLYLRGNILSSTVYLVSMSLTGFLLTMQSWMDGDVKTLPVCLRPIVCPILGFTHLSFATKSWAVYKKTKNSLDDLNIAKTIHATLQATPIGIATLMLLVQEDAQNADLSWMQIFSTVSSFHSMGSAVCSYDCTDGSVVCRLVQNFVWKEMLGAFRMLEIAGRLLCGCLLHQFCEQKLGVSIVVPIVLAVEFLITAILVRVKRVARKLPATIMAAAVSLVSNVYLFQEESTKEELSQILQRLRMFEYVSMFAVAGYYFKYVPGGSRSLLDFATESPQLTGVTLFFVLAWFLAVPLWAQIKQRARVEGQWESQS